MDTTSDLIDLDALLAPISDDAPSGEDLAFDPVFDEIKEARRADDPTLAQGEWQSELKVANWRVVKELAIEVLSTRSKDYQVACWLTEALAQMHRFAGVEVGLRLLTGLTERFWDDIHPAIEDGDLDARASRFASLDANLAPALAELPLTAPAAGGYGLRRYREAREVDNRGRQSPELMEAALAEGKINSELWAKALAQTQSSFYEELAPLLEQCRAAFQELDRMLGEKFGLDAPSLKQLQDTIDGACQLVGRIARERGLGGSGEEEAPADEGASSDGAAAGEYDGAAGGGTSHAFTGGTSGPVQSRREALQRLAEVADYFRRAEPHSPVSFLVNRAVRWGDMSLDQWLAEVVKDPTTLGSLYETLGLGSDGGAGAGGYEPSE
jgi:type VI secretion system protein ImpA